MRYLEPHGPGAAGLQHLHGGIEGRPHLGGGAVEEEVGGNANPQPPHVPIECSFVVRDRLGRGRRIGCIMAGDDAQQARAIAGCACERSYVVGREGERHGSVAGNATAWP